MKQQNTDREETINLNDLLHMKHIKHIEETIEHLDVYFGENVSNVHPEPLDQNLYLSYMLLQFSLHEAVEKAQECYEAFLEYYHEYPKEAFKAFRKQ